MFVPTVFVHQALGSILFLKLLENVLLWDFGKLDGHGFQGRYRGVKEVGGTIGSVPGLLDCAPCLLNLFWDVFERHAYLGVDERDFGGVLAYQIEYDLLAFSSCRL